MIYTEGTGKKLAKKEGLIMSRQWKVGELAKATGLTIRTLHYYDQIGLFSPSGHSASGHRLYSEKDFSRLQQILSLKDLGLSLEEIQGVLANERYDPLEAVSLQISRLRESIRIQQKLLKQLVHVAHLMQSHAPVSVDDFTQLFDMMRKSHERYFAEKQANMERHLELLGDFLAELPESPHPKEDS